MSETLVRRATPGLLVGGRWIDTADTYEIVNPATEEPVGAAPEATVEQAQAAAAAAREAFPAWSRTTPKERFDLLLAAAQRVRERMPELVPLVQAETGATITVTKTMQVPVCAGRLERYAYGALEPATIPITPLEVAAHPLSQGGSVVGGVAVRQPVGVVACITPYNFPIVNCAGKIGPALAMGNTVVVKPAPQDPLAVVELVRILDEVGFPPGVVNVVTGSGPAVGQALVESPDVDMVSFTGSTTVGQAIAAAGAATMKRLLLELGGKSANLVFDDAPLERAVPGSASVWTFHSGQICTAPTRLFVQRGVYDRFVEGLTTLAGYLQVGDPLDPKTVVGPLISAAQRERVEGYVQIGRDEGAEVACGGDRPDLDRGWFVNPTLLAQGRNDMRVAREEIFGPVIVAIPFDDEDEGIALANDSEFGLHGYVWTADTARGLRVARQLRTGNVSVNGAPPNPEAPFGGFKMSGIGRDGGSFALAQYSELQSIVWPA